LLVMVGVLFAGLALSTRGDRPEVP